MAKVLGFSISGPTQWQPVAVAVAGADLGVGGLVVHPSASDRYTVTYPLASAGSLGTDTGHLYFSWDISYIFETNEHTYLFQAYNIQLFFAASNAAYKAGQFLWDLKKIIEVVPGTSWHRVLPRQTHLYQWLFQIDVPRCRWVIFEWNQKKEHGFHGSRSDDPPQESSRASSGRGFSITLFELPRSLGAFTGTEVQLWRPS